METQCGTLHSIKRGAQPQHTSEFTIFTAKRFFPTELDASCINASPLILFRIELPLGWEVIFCKFCKEGVDFDFSKEEEPWGVSAAVVNCKLRDTDSSLVPVPSSTSTNPMPKPKSFWVAAASTPLPPAKAASAVSGAVHQD